MPLSVESCSIHLPRTGRAVGCRHSDSSESGDHLSTKHGFLQGSLICDVPLDERKALYRGSCNTLNAVRLQ
jgi:hypothetical protein